MLPIDDGEIESIRAEIERALPDTVYRLVETRISDGQGGWSSTWGTVATMAGRLDPVSGREQIAGGALTAYHRFKLTIPQEETALPTDHWSIGGVIYAAVSVSAGSWLGCKRVEVERL